MAEKRFCPQFIADVIAQCKNNPSRVAVIDGKGRVNTYGDFLEIIERTSGYIKSKGIGPKSFIVINIPNSMEYLAIEYGVWLSGCAIVPASPLYPKERIDYISGHCEAKLVVDEDVLAEIRKADRLEICEPQDDIAAIFYTSGSTGNPKGVIHTFETLSHIDRFDEVTDVNENDCFATGAPLSFIACLLTVPFLRCGACVRMFDRETITDISLLQKCYDTENITGAVINPSTYRQISLSNNHSLRFVVTGTERVANMKPESSYRLINIYGMTETALMAFIFDVDKAYQNTPIGKPMSDYEFKLMDDGEICVRGVLTPGYYKDPEKSAALWRGGWLHTGDIGRLLPDGNLEYVNRKDWMVKINGQRVETGEISAVMKTVNGVKDAIAKGFESQDGHQYIVGYYIADDSVDNETVRSFISKKLAPYMIPSHFVKMSSFPVNMNGKLDMKALQSPVDTATDSNRKITAPENELQTSLCKAFETSLGIAPIGIDDDFFAMGGDSIRVMQLQNLCKEYNLTSSMVYRYRCVKALSEAVSSQEDQQIHSSKDKDDYPLSQSQTGIFIESINRKGEIAYNNPFLLRISSNVDANRLAKACETALAAHPNIFASLYMDEKGAPRQKKGNPKDVRVEVETIKESDFDSIKHTLVKPFDILNDQLFRVKIFKSEKNVWLFFDFHHIIFDGTSNTVLLDDIEKAYAGEAVEPESLTGFDIAEEEIAERSSSYYQQCREWNLDTFSDIDGTSLPDPDLFDDVISFDSFDVNTNISSVTFAKAAERLGVTENVLALGAFGYMLGACNHAMSSAFATIYNGRKSFKSARTVSMMVKTLPASFKWDAQTKIGEYFQAVKEQLTGAMANDLFSFAEICQETAFDSRVIFTYQDTLLDRETLCGAKSELISLLDNATGEPFAVQLFKKNDILNIRVEYRSNMYSQRYIDGYIRCFNTILNELLTADKDAATSSIQLVSAKESASLIENGWGRKLDFDTNDTFVTMFRRSVEKYPEAIAVVDENGSISYAELDKLSDVIAKRIIDHGVKQEEFVALMLPRLMYYPASYVACFKSGAAYVPMDYEYPVERLQYMLEDSQSKVLLTTRAIYEEKCKECELKVDNVIYVDEIVYEGVTSEHIDNSRPDTLAYMIYTSGTTGKPKGVMIEHHSLANLVQWWADTENVGYGARIAEHSSFSFDGSLPDLMPPLCFGGELHILPSSIRKDLGELYRYFCENRIDGVTLTTQLGLTMLKMYDLKLKYLIMGGEKMVGPFNTKVRIYNGYGPTEFTVWSSSYLVDNDNVPDNIPIGKAVPNTMSVIVDSLGRLLPKGVAGELALVGCQISRGYWHREDITAKRFVDCPFLPGEKMYRTGDLAKLNDDNELLFLGRIDSQVKLRGFRIELGEIESTMAKYDGVKNSVAAIKEIAGVQHLIGYYCSDKELDNEAFRAFLATTLTDYMVPTALVRLDTMPMTPNGKIDLRKLPVPEIKAETIVAPESEMEQKIFDVVADYLNNNAFGVTTNLITMGVTSLGAISLSVLLEKSLGIKIPSSKILEIPNIRGWIGLLGDGKTDSSDEVPCKYDLQEDYPLTDNQLGIYIDWEQHRGGTQYNVPLLFHFKGVDPEKVASAVKCFTDAHTYLKTRFKVLDGQTRQVRRDDTVIEVPVVKLDISPDKSLFQKRILPFDLFGGPLCRFEVYHYGDECWLLSDVHHIIFDGGSESIFAQEIVASLKGQEIEPEQFSAFDYALYYQQWKDSDDYEKAETYFNSLLEGVTFVSLPNCGCGEGEGSGSIELKMPRDGVRQYCRKVGVTENAFYLRAMTETLHRFTREDNISILTVSSGRSLSSLEKTTGMFVQTLPVVSHQTQRSIKESLESMQHQVVETLARDKFPFTKIVENSGAKTNILVAYQGDVINSDSLVINDNPVELIGLALDTAKVPLSLNVTPGKDETTLLFEYDRSQYNAKDVEIFAKAVRALAMGMAQSDADSMIGSVSCVSVDEVASVISVGKGVDMSIDENATIVKLFKKHATEHPEDIAVVDEVSSITYGELDRQSDILAGMLLSNGLKQEDFVGLMLPRRKEYSIAYMAVFKSGGAFVPMDYEYPLERLQYMIDDSNASIMLTTKSLFESKVSEGGLKVQNVIFIEELDLSKERYTNIDNSTPSSLAYMIYTSGTTGKPKGVMLEHRGLANVVTWNAKAFDVRRGTHIAEHASFSFDASIMDLMTPLANGATLYIIGEGQRKDPEQIYKFLCDNSIEYMAIATQLGMLLMNSYDLPLRYLMVGGEKLSGTYNRGTQFVNGYGPTEFTVSSSYHILDQKREVDNIPIGKAVPNTISAVVDGCGQLLPMGVAGELVLIGPQLARGYWNKPENTKKAFVDCPFIPGEKMYRTGDLVRWNDEGELLFISRIDTQVKLRGFRIELGEVESVMAKYNGVKTAVAQVKEIGGVQHLCGYFTSDIKIDQEELRRHLASCLTPYMVPDAFVQLDEMPLTPNGKVNLKALPIPELSSHGAAQFAAPEGEIETTIAEAFAAVLGTANPIGRNDSFFEIGGTSLLVMKVIVRLSEAGMKVTYGDVFKYSTPSTLAAFIEGIETAAKSISVEASTSSVSASRTIPTVDEDGYDYTNINSVLSSNRVDNIGGIGDLDANELGDILLLGSTGYLGIHILHQLLTETNSKVYCVIRPKRGVTTAGRMKSYLMYYFDNTFAELLDKRLMLIEGDMTNDSVMDTLLQIKVNTVINCAANVKHFAPGDEIEKINLHGTELLIEYCLKTGSRLIQTSTHSISGQMEDSKPFVMGEDYLYFGQKMMTKYQTSKFQAERAILEAVGKGLKAKIMRLGNLMPRYSDGEFQINMENNGFLARMRAYYLIGCIASSHLHSVLEFAHIDETASAVLKLAATPDKFTVFHPFNNHNIYIDDVVAIMRKCGLEIKIVDDDVFSARLNECLNDDHLNPYITTLLAYGSHNNYVMNTPSLDFTVNVLNAMDWRWSITSERYLVEVIEKLKALEYFNK